MSLNGYRNYCSACGNEWLSTKKYERCISCDSDCVYSYEDRDVYSDDD